jgi:hypothetical protein
MLRHRLAQWLAATVVGFAACGAKADTISFTADQADSTSHLLNFSALLTVSMIDSTHYDIHLSMTNTTTPSSVGGFITGVLLNNPGNITAISINPQPSTLLFTQLGLSNPDIKASPFGFYDFGAALGGDWEGGGAPGQGIGIGSTGVFDWTATISGGTLTAAAIYASLGDDNEADFSVAVRSKGYTPDNSDKTPGGPGTLITTPVPAPPALVLCLIGAAGLFGQRALARKRTPKMA